MSHLIQNTFSTYQLDEDELVQGSLLTTLQKQVIQTQIGTIADEKLRLEFDSDKPMQFMQQEAYKRGQLDALNYLLQASEALELDTQRTP
jgi:hypothetical protein